MLVRRIARPLLASSFIVGGIDTLRNPQSRVPGARPVVEKVTETIFWERSVSLFELRFGRADAESGGDIGYQIRTRMLALLTILQDVDDAPTTQATAAVAELEKAFPPVMAKWKTIQTQDLPALNSQLRQANLPELRLEANPEPQESGGNRE